MRKCPCVELHSLHRRCLTTNQKTNLTFTVTMETYHVSCISVQLRSADFTGFHLLVCEIGFRGDKVLRMLENSVISPPGMNVCLITIWRVEHIPTALLFLLVVLGKMRSAVGSAQLLMSQKFQQFRELCEENLVSKPSLTKFGINFVLEYVLVEVGIYDRVLEPQRLGG